MSDEDMDQLDRNRRHFLTVATVVTGLAGVGAIAYPFLSSLKPSARSCSGVKAIRCPSVANMNVDVTRSRTLTPRQDNGRENHMAA